MRKKVFGFAALATAMVIAIAGLSSNVTLAGSTKQAEARAGAAAIAGERVDKLKDLEPVEFPRGVEYRFKGQNATYGMDERSNEVTSILWHNERGTNFVISSDEALKQAYKTARRYFRQFDVKNFELIMAEQVDHGITAEYHFLWREMRDGVLYPSYVTVSINPETGAPMLFSAQNFDVADSVRPKLTREQAIAKAKSLASSDTTKVKAADFDVWILNAQPAPRWHVELASDDGLKVEMFDVNDQTGELFPGGHYVQKSLPPGL